MKLKYIYLVIIVELIGVFGFNSVGAEDRPPPPKASVQEPTDWTKLNSPPGSWQDTWVRTLIIDNHYCIVAYNEGYREPSVSLSCDNNSR